MPEPQDAWQVVNMAGQVLAIFTQPGEAEAWLRQRGASPEARTGLWVTMDDDGDIDAEYEIGPAVINDEEMSLSEAAERYGVKHDTLRKAANEGRLNAPKRGHDRRVTHAAMKKYLSQ